MNKRQAYYILDPKTDTKQEGDEYYNTHHRVWFPIQLGDAFDTRLVYRRPVPDAVTLDDGWIPWSGGPCPVDRNATIQWRLRSGTESKPKPVRLLSSSFWEGNNDSFDVIAYKVIEQAPKQPLGPDDVPPGSVIRGAGEKGDSGWCLITSCSLTGIRLWRHSDTNQTETKWATLMESESEIKRPGEDWKPCCK